MTLFILWGIVIVMALIALILIAKAYPRDKEAYYERVERELEARNLEDLK